MQTFLDCEVKTVGSTNVTLKDGDGGEVYNGLDYRHVPLLDRNVEGLPTWLNECAENVDIILPYAYEPWIVGKVEIELHRWVVS